MCPIYRNAFYAINHRNKNIVFSAWDFVDHKPGIEKDLCKLRNSYDIAHGFGMAINRGDITESLCFGAKPREENFYKNMANRDVVVKTLDVFRRTFS